MSRRYFEVDRILSGFRRGALSRRQALRALGTVGLAATAAPLLDFTALADEAGKQAGPGGIPLSRPNKPVTLPVHGSPIKSGLKPEGGKFIIYNYQDYIDKKVTESFAKKYDCEVVLTTFDSMDEAITKLASGLVKADATDITPDRIAQAVAGKLVAPLNHSYIPNLAKNVWPSLQSPFYDQGSQYTVPYVIYSMGIGWRSDKVSEDIHKLDNPWSIFWNAQKYNGYVGILDDSRESLAMAMLYRNELDVNTEDPAIIDKALADLKATIPICNPKINITEYQTLGDASSWLHQSWSGDLLGCAISYVPEGTDKELLQYWTPPKGKSCVQNDGWALLAKSEKPVLGHLWLNHLLDADVAISNFTDFTGYQPPQNTINADQLIKDGVIPKSLKTAIMGPDDFGPESLQECALTPKGQKLYQDAYARFNSGA
jgi:spermidine/putrescine transport system substrate-binding protein